MSEVDPRAGWVELYNRGPSVADLHGWSLAGGAGSATVALPAVNPLPVHGFAVFEAAPLKLGQAGGTLVLRRPDGTVADMVTLGPVEPNRSWSRYPVHGGVWTANTPLTRGLFNLPAPEVEEATAVSTTVVTTSPSIVATTTPPVDRGNPVLLIGAMLAVAAAVRSLVAGRTLH